MANIRIMVGAAAIAAFTFALAPASARSCEHRDSACAESGPGAPLSLLQFTKQHRTAKAAHGRMHEKPVIAKSTPKVSAAATAAQASADLPAPADSTADVAKAAPPSAAAAVATDASADTPETDGVAVVAPDAWNEIDARADKIKVVDPDDVNEIDLAAGPAPAAAGEDSKALASMAAAGEPTGDSHWLGKLLAAIGGTIALAAGARLLIA
jgi:hypothetical protein